MRSSADQPGLSAASSTGGCGATRRSRELRLLLVISCMLIGVADRPAMSRPGMGYGDLIDKYCIKQGRLRVAAHQGHCAACHHQGTFDSAPEHRVEPNWTEFERGRSNEVFDFFCPPAQAVTAAAPGTRPSGGASRVPPAMGIPPAAPAEPRSSQAQPPPASSAGPAQSRVKPHVVATAQTGTFEFAGQLAAIHDTVRIEPGQEPAWREFVDAVAAVMRSEKRPAAAGAPTAYLKARERDHSERIVALRALDLALSRLGAGLNETQRRSLSDGLAPLLDAM